jgi:GTP-binding protein EngB required for normal cell division
MTTPKLDAVSTVRGYIQSIYTKIDQVKESKRNTLNNLMSTSTEVQYTDSMATVHTSTINAIELLSKELSEKQTYLAHLKHSVR